MTPPLVSQRGAALLTGLIFLVILTLLTLSAMKATSLEERMAGNARDQDIAFQAAEAAIRDVMLNRIPTLSPASAFVAGCAAGLCLPDNVTPVWTTISNNNEWNTAKTAQYPAPSATGGSAAPALANVVAQPSYIIEYVPGAFAPEGFSMDANARGVTAYRITARGWGRTPQAAVTLQSTIHF